MSEIAPALARALDKGWSPFLLFYCDHPSGAVRYWTRTGKRTIAGHEYIGLGVIGKITGATRSTDLSINEVTFELRGVPPTSAQMLSGLVRNRVATVTRGAISARGQIVVDDDPTIDALLDYQKLSVDPSSGMAKIILVGQQGFVILDRAQDLALTDQQQRSEFDGDTGMSLTHAYATRESNWRAA